MSAWTGRINKFIIEAVVEAVAAAVVVVALLE